ncbi:hypothetical protein [Pacificoceanicola onchidii]|nr:hypothetical protein [Pacificoceanicola onchidii]
MTNRLAVILGLIIVGAVAADYAVYGNEHLLFLARKFFDLLQWVAFWR